MTQPIAIPGGRPLARPKVAWDARMADVDDAELLALLKRESKPPADALKALEARIRTLRHQQPPLAADDFLALTDRGVAIVDVRSPREFAAGHIPGARSAPLFDNDERARVGTTYKFNGHDSAVALGMSLVRPRLSALLHAIRDAAAESAAAEEAPTVGIYCWRGGMRSGSVGWLLCLHGVRAHVLDGGYKGFRAWVRDYWHGVALPPKRHAMTQKERDAAGSSADGQIPPDIVAAARALPGPRVCVIGGRTGVGKTRVLLALRHVYARHVLDLEGLANHRGSTFGWVGARGGGQPSSEQYSNDVALAWRRIARHDAGVAGGGESSHAAGGGPSPRGWMFIEDEDTHVGKVDVPAGVYAAMRCAPLVVRIHASERARLRLLVDDYAGADARRGHGGDGEGAWRDGMVESIQRMGRRLGGAETERLSGAVRDGRFEDVAAALLGYYDKLYDAHVANCGGQGSGAGSRCGVVRDAGLPATSDEVDAEALAMEVLERVREFEASECEDHALRRQP